MEYIIELKRGINAWTAEDYKTACSSFMRGLELFTDIRPTEFFLAGVTPGTNFLGTICDGLNEGKKLWDRFYPDISKQIFPVGGYHIGWMAFLLAILLEITSANWILTQNAKGYSAMVNLDELYLAALRSAERRSIHRVKTAPIFEYALGRALYFDSEAGVFIAEHMTSPISRELLGSLYPNAYPIKHEFRKEYEHAKKMSISESIDKNQEIMKEAVGTKDDVGKLKEWLANESKSFLGYAENASFRDFIYQTITMEPDIGRKISSVPQASVQAIRKSLKANEALILINTYEDSVIFLVISAKQKSRCYIIR
ncbi:MAG: hypothetical protein ACFFB3_16330, partial [Candidatus Hodarchaeota archaeon]